jgi:small GTP-binding protein
MPFKKFCTRPMQPARPPVSRVVIIGDFSVGKTCLVNRFVDDNFTPYQQSTVGADYQVRDYAIDGRQVQLQMWDTAGHEKYRALGPLYFRDALGAVVVYDLTSRASFDSLEMWIRYFTAVAGSGSVIAIAGNKSDLTADYQVTVEEGRGFACEKGAIFGATSAKTGSGVKEFFHEFIGEVVRRNAGGVRLNGGPAPESESVRACGC